MGQHRCANRLTCSICCCVAGNGRLSPEPTGILGRPPERLSRTEADHHRHYGPVLVVHYAVHIDGSPVLVWDVELTPNWSSIALTNKSLISESSTSARRRRPSPARRAASRPMSVSSNTTHAAGGTPSRRAASRNTSGSGLWRGVSSARHHRVEPVADAEPVEGARDRLAVAAAGDRHRAGGHGTRPRPRRPARWSDGVDVGQERGLLLVTIASTSATGTPVLRGRGCG